MTYLIYYPLINLNIMLITTTYTQLSIIATIPHPTWLHIAWREVLNLHPHSIDDYPLVGWGVLLWPRIALSVVPIDTQGVVYTSMDPPAYNHWWFTSINDCFLGVIAKAGLSMETESQSVNFDLIQTFFTRFPVNFKWIWLVMTQITQKNVLRWQI